MSRLEIFRNQSCFFAIEDHVLADDGKTYLVGERIAAGGNAVVHDCMEKLSGESFAIKFQLELKQLAILLNVNSDSART